MTEEVRTGKRRYVKLLVISKICLIFAMILLALIIFGPTMLEISIERIYVLTIIVPTIIILLIPIMIYWILPKEN